MENPPNEGRRKLRVRHLGVVLLGLWAAAAVYYYFDLHRYDLPHLPIVELDGAGKAGEVNLQNGETFSRISKPADTKDFALVRDFRFRGPEWAPVPNGATLLVGLLYRLGARAALHFKTTGNFIIGLDDEGEFILQDARRDAEAKRHTMIWVVKQGTLRAKHHDYDSTEHWLEIRTPRATVLIHQGEGGVRVPPDGKEGLVWWVKGEMVVQWHDGRRKVINQKGLHAL